MSTLVEVMICFFILSLMILGVDATQIVVERQAKIAYFSSVAQQQLNNFSEQLLAITNEPLEQKLQQWNQYNQIVLPEGYGTLESGSSGPVATIYWGAYKNDGCQKNRLALSGCMQRIIRQRVA